MRVHMCGVRGSTPAVGPEFARVGGNTSCVALAHDGDPAPTLILDAGTGLRAVSSLLADEPFRGTILLGHLHWDHTQGLPFFRAGDRPDAVVRLLLPEQPSSPIELVRRFMSPPAFPIDPTQLMGAWSFGSIDEGEHEIENFGVLAREIPHKGGRTFGYRISDGRSTIAYLSDHGPAGAIGPGPGGLGPFHEAAIELAADVDLLIHDAQHTAAELPARAGYGHSAAEYAVELAERAGAGRVALFHHDPTRTDDQIDRIERTLRDRATLDVRAAREGEVFEAV